ncbi:hypothetical protein UFOVP669_21 [uncultured Caudovirales phage]|uniref:Uncharacterized protein n=1 Tax=uncultured Caudovirales phage TaxID=2100421 RepID=A0A6J5NEQ8_9CAUD|nr:hypothetical protein UFOVP400_12 [uncultured Caudovirales phage]CAB4155665.1 hypothetical protein UFOVP669_21 [uncultured Caudovirales phage]CAB4213560.1 hypothetical protein UFOVP1449_50 [uncultured Caudovirales phage]
MNDRELLEYAAKAAGIDLGMSFDRGSPILWDCSDPEKHKPWNPLTDDGDALRLAVKLNLLQKHSFTYALAEENDECNGDPYAATRRAIVRAAAEIGRHVK